VIIQETIEVDACYNYLTQGKEKRNFLISSDGNELLMFFSIDSNFEDDYN
jgi:hypothetical protein